MDKTSEDKSKIMNEILLDSRHYQSRSFYTYAQLITIFLLFVGISFFWIKVVTPDGLAASTDSIYYIETAASLQDGRGASMGNREIAAFGKS